MGQMSREVKRVNQVMTRMETLNRIVDRAPPHHGGPGLVEITTMNEG